MVPEAAADPDSVVQAAEALVAELQVEVEESEVEVPARHRGAQTATQGINGCGFQ